MARAYGDIRWLETLPLLEDRPWLRLALTLAITGAALLARFALGPYLPPGLPYATFFPAVILAAFLFGARAGLLAALLGGVLGWVFFVHDPMAAPMPGTAPSVFLYVVADVLILLLFHELQHRVSNNLQVAAGLLSLQKRHVADPGAQHALDEAVRRIATIGRISRQLYHPNGEAQGVRELFEPLIAGVIEANGKPVSVTIEDPDALRLAPDAVVPVALIVAEAVANAIEHGFAERAGGSVTIRCAALEPGFVIEIEDDGAGLRDDFELTRHASLGLQIAATLAGQLGGHFEMLRRPAGSLARLVAHIDQAR